MFHGVAATEMIQQIYAPRRALIQCGNHSEISFEKETLLAEILVPMTAKDQQSAEKN